MSDRCEAEVRRVVSRLGLAYAGQMGSRQSNEYEYGRCTRPAVLDTMMYPPRSDYNAMHPVGGRVCRQHAIVHLPRKWSSGAQPAETPGE